MPSKPPLDGKISKKGNVVKVDFNQAKPKPANSLKTTDHNLQKFVLFSDLLEKGIVSIVFNAKREEVQVPVQFKDALNLRLNFSHRYQIKDFAFSEEGVSATLSFSEGFYFCVIPWHVVYLIEMVEGDSGAVWSEDIPTELLPYFDLKNDSKLAVASKKNKKKPKATSSAQASEKSPAPFLRLVKDESAD